MDRERTARTLPRPFSEVLSAETLDLEPASVCVIDVAGRIVFTNRTWDRLGADNGGWAAGGPSVVGTRWLDAIAGEAPRRLFGEALAHASGLAWNAPRTVIVHGFCHSPTHARDMVTQLSPITSPDRARTLGVLAMSQILAVEPIAQRYDPAPPDPARHGDTFGLILQCCGCRRVQVRDEQLWEFVPAYVAQRQGAISHGVCAVCLELFYGREIAERARERANRDRS